MHVVLAAAQYIHGFSGIPTLLYFKTYDLGPAHDWVVFVHGAGGSSRIWFGQVRAFRQYFNVLLVDLRGHGKSGNERPPSGTYTMESLGRDILEVLDHLEIRQAHFVGISLGSLLIRTLAEIEPTRVATMELGGAVTHLDRSVGFWVWLGEVTKQVVPYLLIYRVFVWVIMPGSRHRRTRALFAREARRSSQEAFKQFFSLARRAPALLRHYRENDVPIPTLYLMGASDYLFLPSARAIVQKHTHATLAVIDGAGHICNVEAPQAFNERAIAFIQAHPVGGKSYEA